jgi:hypothetical protein
MKMILWFFTVVVLLVGHAFPSYAGEQSNRMDKVYSDESHCLVAPEIRGEKDSSISCFCRDAIMDARYIFQTYLLSGKDSNLNGSYLELVDHAQRICGEKYSDVLNATQAKEWQWEGPQVKREYPTDAEIVKIKPDSNGLRSVKYKVHLIYFDKEGHAVKVEDFNAVEKEPANLKK